MHFLLYDGHNMAIQNLFCTPMLTDCMALINYQSLKMYHFWYGRCSVLPGKQWSTGIFKELRVNFPNFVLIFHSMRHDQ